MLPPRLRGIRASRRPSAATRIVPADVFEALRDPVIACGTDGMVVCNRPARELHGLPRDPLPFERWAARHRVYVRGVDRPVAAEDLPLQRALRGEEVVDDELEVRGEESARTFLVSAHPLGRGGGPGGALCIMRERDEATWIASMPFGPILAHAAEGVALVCSATGTFIYVNDAWARPLGYDAAELVGRHVSQVLSPSDRAPEQVGAEMLRALDGGGVWRGELEQRRADGSPMWAELSVSGFEDEQGRTAWIIVGRDVTARVARDTGLREAERRFRGTFEAGPFGMALVGDDRRLLEVNAAFAAITGYTRDELMGRSLDELTDPAEIDTTRLLDVDQLGELARHQLVVRYRTKGGGHVRVALTATVVRDVDGSPLHAVVMIDRLPGLT